MASDPSADSGEYPSLWADLRRQSPEPPTADVPEALRGLSSAQTRRTKAIQFVPRAHGSVTRDADPARTVAASRPPWVAASFKPHRLRSSPPPRVRHHQAELSPLVIWPPDDRRTYNDTSYPWGCVCRIITAAGRIGSGVLIGPRHVLTASHCVDWSTDAAELIEVHRNGTTLSASAFDTVAIAFTQVVNPPGMTELDEDYAVLVMNERLGDRFGYMGSKLYDAGWDDEHLWITIGYPTDIASGLVPTFQSNVSLDEDEFDVGSARAMTTSADAMRGQSGSPMFAFWGGLPYVVAVVSADGSVWASGTENWCSGGSDLNRLIRIARQDHP